jgi:transposase
MQKNTLPLFKKRLAHFWSLYRGCVSPTTITSGLKGLLYTALDTQNFCVLWNLPCSDQESDDEVQYKATTMHVEVRNYIGRVAKSLKEEGVSYKQQREIADNAGYHMSDRIFKRYCRIGSGQRSPLSANKPTGRPPALDDRQKQVFLGWVLIQNDANEIVDLAGCVEFVQTHFNVQLVDQTMANYLHEAGFTSQLGRRRTAGYKLDLDQMADLYKADVLRLWKLGIKTIPRNELPMMDSTSVGWCLFCQRTYAVHGGNQPKIANGNPSYTNLIVWVVWADGVNRTPALLFTGDPALIGCGQGWEHLPDILKQYHIKEDCIVAVPGKTYVGENNAVIKAFLDRYPVLRDKLLVSDAGNAYKKKETDIIVEWGAKHAVFTPAVHQHESVLDNHCFGILKGTLCSAKIKKDD